MDEDGILLPPPSERAWIEHALAELIRAQGAGRFVRAPLWSTTPEDFPDPWANDGPSLQLLVQRLTRYADAVEPAHAGPAFADASIEITLYRDEDIGGPLTPAGAGSTMWWVSRKANTLRFAARVSALREPLRIVPAAARAVTEAWRAWVGLRDDRDDRTEQRRVDLTTVYLGFGGLTTDASIRHGATRTDTFRLQRTTSHLGVLPPQSFAYALALQLRVRGQAPRPIVARLQDNQAAFVRAGLAHLAATQFDAEALGIPPSSAWPPAPDVARLRRPAALPAPSGGLEPDAAALEDRGVLGRNRGRPVFRVVRTKATRLARAFGLPVVLLGMLATQMRFEVQYAYILPVAAALAVLGLLVGRWLPDSRCSEPQCSTPLPPDATTCPRCEGTIAGIIHHPRERLAAEEAWFAQQRRATTAPAPPEP